MIFAINETNSNLWNTNKKYIYIALIIGFYDIMLFSNNIPV